MSRGRRGRGQSAAATGELALNTAIIVAAAATAILLLSALLRVAWPESAGARPSAGRAGGRHSRATTSEVGAAARSEKVIRVQVLNGCGVGGAGASMASLLRRSGDIDVSEIGNADRFDFETTIVVDRTGHAATARRVAHIVGDPAIVLQRALEERFDVTVIVGYDKGRWLAPVTPAAGR